VQTHAHSPLCCIAPPSRRPGPRTADRILSLATDLTQTSQPDGTTVYTGTIPSTFDDKGTPPSDDEIMRIISSLSRGNDTGLQLELTVGADDIVRQIELTTGGTYTWTVTYSRLGTTPSRLRPRPHRRLR